MGGNYAAMLTSGIKRREWYSKCRCQECECVYLGTRCSQALSGWRLWIIAPSAHTSASSNECHSDSSSFRYSSGNMPRVSYPIPGTSQIPAVAGVNVKPYVNAAAGSSSSIVRYDPYAPPRRPVTTTTTAPSTSSGPPSELHVLSNQPSLSLTIFL